MTHGTFAGSGDEPHYLAIAHSIAFDADLDLSNNYGGDEPLIAGGTLSPGPHVVHREGWARPVHDIGLPLLAAPYVRVAAPLATLIATYAPASWLERARLNASTLYRHLLSLAMIAATILLWRESVATSRLLGPDDGQAIRLALLVVLSPPLLIFSILFFTEIPAALLVIALFRRIVVSPVRSTAGWALAGAGVGLLWLLHTRNIAICCVLAAAAVVATRQRRNQPALWSFAGGLALPVAFKMAVTHALWDSLLTTPHSRLGAWTGIADLAGVMATRLAGLLVDQEFGLLPYAPVLLLAIAGWAALRARTPRPTTWLALIAGAYVLSIVNPITNVHGWTGGWSPPARFLVPLVPLFIPLVVEGSRRVPRPLLIALVVTQVVISAYFWSRPKELWNDGNGIAAVCEAHGWTCRLLPSLVSTTDRIPAPS